MELCLHIARDPVRHRVLGAAAKEDARRAKRDPERALAAFFRAVDRLARAHIRDRGEHKEDCRDYRQGCEKEHEELPTLVADELQEQSADHDYAEHAKGVERVEQAHVLLGIVRRDRRDHRAEQNLG